MSEHIPLSVPSITGNEWKYIKECLDTGWVSSAGKYVEEFESQIAEYTGSKFAVACVNGTAALHTSLLLAGVKPGDEVIVPTITFIAPVNAVKYCNAFPVFMDADEYYNIDTVKVIEFLETETILKNGYTYSRRTNRRISVFLPVHVFGNAVFFDRVYDACRERNIKIVEDATESLGTKYVDGRFSGRHTGTIGDVGCLSFNGNKIITTGGGGMILTNDENLAARAKYLTTQAKQDELRYIHGEVGYNYRLTNIQAALGVAQLENLERFVLAKKKNYRLYKEGTDRIEGLHLADVPPYADDNTWMYALQIDKVKYGMDREQLMNKMTEHGIQTRPVWQPNHLQLSYANEQSYRIERAPNLHDITLNLPCSVELQERDLNLVMSVLKHE